MEEIKDIRQIQLIVLDIMKTFHGICVKHGIPYFLTAGGLIGAIRHKGFIPWDDDLDVVIPRKYFSQLIKILHKELPPYYSVVSRAQDPAIWGEMVKIEDSRTLVIEDDLSKDVEHGAFIDLFVLDYSDDNQSIFSRHGFIKRIFQLYYYTRSNSLTPVVLLAKLVCLPFGKNGILNLIKYIVPNHGPLLTPYSGSYGEKEVIDKEIWGSPTLYHFEDTEFYSVEHYDEYLTRVYGDYMTIPPLEKRHFHLTKMYYR